MVALRFGGGSGGGGRGACSIPSIQLVLISTMERREGKKEATTASSPTTMKQIICE